MLGLEERVPNPAKDQYGETGTDRKWHNSKRLAQAGPEPY